MAIRWLTVFLDFPGDSFDAGVTFWRAVTGYGLSASRGANGEFATLLPPSGDAYVRVQRLASDTGGCHLDLHVETAEAPLDSVAAQAEALGARVRYREPEELIILQSPGGFTFCLVRWDGEAVLPPVVAGDSGSDPLARVHTLCLDVPPAGFADECAFWTALTGWEQRPVAVPGYTALRRPPGLPARLLLQRLDSAEPGQPVRGHVDLDAGDEKVADLVTRHVAIGARVVGSQPYWTVLTDPAGREYCVVGRSG